MIAFDEIDKRLEALELTRGWLAEVTGRSPGSIRSALAPNADPTKRSELLQKALSDAILAEEARRAADHDRLQKAPPGYSKIFLSDEEIDLADQASRLASAPSLAAFCHDVIQGEARRIIAEHAERLRLVEAQSKIVELPPSGAVAEHAARQYWIDGRGGIAAGDPIDTVVWEPKPVGKEYPDDHYALKVFGRSMEPKVPDGSTIIVREVPDHTFPRKGTIVVYSDGSGATLKEFGYRKAREGEEAGISGVPVLRSLNPLFKDVQTMEGGRIDAVLVEVLPQE